MTRREERTYLYELLQAGAGWNLEVAGRVDSVGAHDGDSVYIDLDLGFDHFSLAHDFEGHPRLECRVYGINAPELGTDAGFAAREYAKVLLPSGTKVMCLSRSWDKYGGRWLGSITLPDGRDFGQAMVDSGHAVPYFP